MDLLLAIGSIPARHLPRANRGTGDPSHDVRKDAFSATAERSNSLTKCFDTNDARILHTEKGVLALLLN